MHSKQETRSEVEHWQLEFGLQTWWEFGLQVLALNFNLANIKKTKKN